MAKYVISNSAKGVTSVSIFEKFKQSVMRKSRTRKLDEFYALCPPDGMVLDVGVSNVDHSPQMNLFLKTFRFPDKCYTGLAVTPMDEIARAYPGKRFVVYDGVDFPFADRSFDFIFSNAVIEHVGDDSDQVAFINEMLRCANQVYFTTPNKFFPVESHTNVLFIHWWSRYFYGWCRKNNPWFSEKNLRLLSHRQLRILLSRSNATGFHIRCNRILGMIMTFSVVCRLELGGAVQTDRRPSSAAGAL